MEVTRQKLRIRDCEVAAILGCCKSTVWSWVKSRPGFPQPRREGARYTYWLRHEVESYALNGITKINEVRNGHTSN